MGLTIQLGVLSQPQSEEEPAVRQLTASLDAVQRALAKAQLPRHVEPTGLPAPALRTRLRGFPYSYLHCLRRAYAHRVADPAWMAAPLGDRVDPASDPCLAIEIDMLRSHLVCHSDSAGFYVPLDFADVLFADREDSEKVAGMVGSSVRLREELLLVAPALGIRLDDNAPPEGEVARIHDAALSGAGLYRELCAWLALYEAAGISIGLKTAIVFS